jgi:hypothetical protein
VGTNDWLVGIHLIVSLCFYDALFTFGEYKYLDLLLYKSVLLSLGMKHLEYILLHKCLWVVGYLWLDKNPNISLIICCIVLLAHGALFAELSQNSEDRHTVFRYR